MMNIYYLNIKDDSATHLNIVRLTTRIYPDKAGPAVYAYSLSKYVSNKNFNFFNITCQPQGVTIKKKLINPYFEINYLPILAPQWDAKIYEHLLFLVKFGIKSIKKIVKIHRKNRIDLIHCDNPAITGLIAVIINRIFNIPYIYTHHGLDSHFKLNFLVELRLVYRFSIYHIIVSRKMKRFFEKNKLDTKKLVWIPVGIDLSKFFHVENLNEKKKIIKELNLTHIIDVNDFIILYVGYMDLKQKVLGMIDFLVGFNNFLKNIDENQKKKMKLLYIGEGKYKSLLENEINKLKLKDHALLLGITLEIEKFYAISDFSALTSYMEGFPTVLLEAVASKVPCICTDVGEVQEIVDENSIIPCGKREDIAAKLKSFYENPDLCEKVSESSFNKIKKFEWDNIAKQIKKIYKKAIIKSNIKKLK